MTMTLGLIILLPFLGSLCVACLPSHARNIAVWLSGSVALACTVLTASLYPHTIEGAVVRLVVPWAPQFGLEMNQRMDGNARKNTMLVSGVGTLVVLYARYYM